MKKRISLIVMALIMVVSIIPMFAIESEAASQGSNYSSNSTIAARIDKALAMFPAGSYFTKNGKACGSCHSKGEYCYDVNGSDCNCLRKVTIDGKPVDLLAVQCLGYARYWQQMLFGYSDLANASKFQDLGGTTDNLTRAKLSEWLNKNQDKLHPGTHLRVRYSGHSIVLLDFDLENETITYIECNWDLKCGVEPIRTLSFDNFISRNWNIYNAFVYKNYYSEYPDKEIAYAKIPEGTYYFNNNGYRMEMKSDKKDVVNVIGCSNASVTDMFKFTVKKDGDYYIIAPTAGKNGFILHAYWLSNCYDKPHNNAPTVNGDEVALYNKIAGDKSQRWIFEECNGGYLIHPADNQSLSVTRTAENRLYVTTTTKAANQIWVLEDATECSHTYGTTFVSNGTHHWKECTKCGDETEKEAHIYDNDCDTKCNVCSRERTVTHSYGATLKSDGTHHWKECTECGDQIQKATHSYDNDCDAYCNGCGRKRTVTHTYGATLKSDGTHHWKECTECGDQIQKATHSYDNDCDATCNVCSREHTVTHTYGATLESNGTHHWKACTKCGAEVEKEAHSYDNACDATCNVCSRERTVAPHSYSATEHDGYTLYTCSVCGDNYKEFHTPEREECQTHSYDEGVVTKKATCTEVGKRKKTCSACGHTVTEDIPKTDHNFGEWFTSGSSDDTEIKHRDCKTCGEYEIKEIEKENTAKSGSIRDWLFDNTEVLLIVCCGVVVVSLLGVAIFKKRK